MTSPITYDLYIDYQQIHATAFYRYGHSDRHLHEHELDMADLVDRLERHLRHMPVEGRVGTAWVYAPLRDPEDTGTGHATDLLRHDAWEEHGQIEVRPVDVVYKKAHGSGKKKPHVFGASVAMAMDITEDYLTPSSPYRGSTHRGVVVFTYDRGIVPLFDALDEEMAPGLFVAPSWGKPAPHQPQTEVTPERRLELKKHDWSDVLDDRSFAVQPIEVAGQPV